MAQYFRTDKPIYLQIADEIIQEIVSNKKSEGEKLPSVRELAIDKGVNPNTIQRVYRELEGKKLAETKRGQGTFVTSDQQMISQWRSLLVKQYVQQFMQDMKKLGFTSEEIQSNLSQFKGGEEDD
ncbi:GntR family transcriptional regulator [Gracilibacillus ureilyticus]|uniref:GntR family transcriptional regulator n=1 Tax=Gracilibacillus ureilyticus TaxID=531814 RepID=A0A1H9TQH2_9BACI|nr:GntR family transcriptional regulator [Gracilibacillus ureilyticus]SER99239.1 GntR family transcriptional regulator [Gracilibacillus ureilyticus]